MAFIATVADDEAAGAAAELISGDRARLGYVPNYTRLFAHRPSVYAAWRQLVTAVAANMDDRRYELATLAAARKLRSSYCMLAHGKVLTDVLRSSEAAGHRRRPPYGGARQGRRRCHGLRGEGGRRRNFRHPRRHREVTQPRPLGRRDPRRGACRGCPLLLLEDARRSLRGAGRLLRGSRAPPSRLAYGREAGRVRVTAQSGKSRRPGSTAHASRCSTTRPAASKHRSDVPARVSTVRSCDVITAHQSIAARLPDTRGSPKRHSASACSANAHAT